MKNVHTYVYSHLFKAYELSRLISPLGRNHRWRLCARVDRVRCGGGLTDACSLMENEKQSQTKTRKYNSFFLSLLQIDYVQSALCPMTRYVSPHHQ